MRFCETQGLGSQPGFCCVVTRGPEQRGSVHQGLKLKGSDSLGLHKRKMYFLPLWAEMAVLCSVN